jgi:hypothetical protein
MVNGQIIYTKLRNFTSINIWREDSKLVQRQDDIQSHSYQEQVHHRFSGLANIYKKVHSTHEKQIPIFDCSRTTRANDSDADLK